MLATITERMLTQLQMLGYKSVRMLVQLMPAGTGDTRQKDQSPLLAVFKGINRVAN